MPIAAMLDGQQIIGPLTSPELWDQCKEAAKANRNRLIMRSTGEPCFPRRSSLGLRHFAHYAGTQATAPESIGHEMLKAVVAKELQVAGWNAELEVPQDGHEWVADILATSPSGQRVAFEIQLSEQTMEDTQYRTDRYTRDGVWTVWITPHEDAIPPDIDAILLNTSSARAKKIDTLDDAANISTVIHRNQKDRRHKKPLRETVRGIAHGETNRTHPLDLARIYAYPCRDCQQPFTAWHTTGKAAYADKWGRFRMSDWPSAYEKGNVASPWVQQEVATIAQDMGFFPKLATPAQYHRRAILACPHCQSFQYDERIRDNIAKSRQFRMHIVAPIRSEPGTVSKFWQWEKWLTPPLLSGRRFDRLAR